MILSDFLLNILGKGGIIREVQEILQWGKKIGNLDLLIETNVMKFDIKIDRNVLPHLLGLHYINHPSDDIRGIRLFNKVRKEKMTDEDIYDKVNENNPEQLDNVKNRIQYFKEFMYNLDKAEIVEMTNPQTKIKSHHLILQTVDNKYLQLGIARGSIADYFETFIVRKNDDYFQGTIIEEKITGIYRYDDECNLIPFSFDPVKAAALEKEYNEQKQRDQEELGESKMSYTAFSEDMEEDEWDLEP